jgi:signal peptidase I
MPESTNPSSDFKPSKIEKAEGNRELLRAIFFCVLVVVLIRSFVIEPFKIPSSSMVPTLRIGDHIFVSKFNFGLVFPFTKWWLVQYSAPKRGEVIVFLFPRDESLHYIKRVVGLPGDKIEVKGRDILINGIQVQKTEVKKVFDQENGALFEETLGDVKHLVKYSSVDPYDFSKTNPVVEVPKDHFFVMGDNRDDSYDSRSWGFVPRENIRGLAQMIWLSLDQTSSWSSLAKVRWERAGMLIY